MVVRSKSFDYQPPYPAYSRRLDPKISDVVLALFAVQVHSNGDSNHAAEVEQLISLLLTKDARGCPQHVDKSCFVDAQGAKNIVFMPYWKNKELQAVFWQRSDVREFVEAPKNGDVGWWVESFHAPVTSLDANYAIKDVRYGIGRHSEVETEQFHAYMGSMRDRVPDYLQGKADACPDKLQVLDTLPQSRDTTIRLNNLPDKLCFIRGGFGWKEATAEEQDAYIKYMLPVYEEGATYLRDNPLESNCISMRMTAELNEHFDTGVQSNAIGWFLSLKDLEKWVRYHPRHLAIMKTILEYMAEFDFSPKLNLGHEVIVVPKEQLMCIYANCHNKTGFLSYFR